MLQRVRYNSEQRIQSSDRWLMLLLYLLRTASGIDKFTMISSVSVTKWYSIINLIGLGKLKLKGGQFRCTGRTAPHDKL
jgi:hypothetical protein